jgi:Uncharacterised ACR, YggU family COG1872
LADPPARRHPAVGQGEAAGRPHRRAGRRGRRRPGLSSRQGGRAPEGGKANAATIRLLAKSCGVAAGALSLVSGAAGRRKLFDVEGDADLLTQRLKALAAER